MDILTVRKIMKNIAQMDDDAFKIEIESLVDDFIESITYLNTLPYNDFIDIYYELFEIALAGELRFTKLFLCVYNKIYTKSPPIRYFENSHDNEITDLSGEGLQLYKDFISTNNSQLRFASFDLSKFPNISKNAYREIIELIKYSLNKETSFLTDVDYVSTMGMLSIARVGAIKYDELCEIYAYFLSYIELITQIGDPQRARDSLEELIIASKYDSIYYCGIIAKLALSVKQRRNFESLFILIFAFLEINKIKIVHKHFFYIFKLSTAQLFRNIHLYKFAYNTFKDIFSTFELDDYTSQQVWNSYFSCKLSEKDETVIQEVENYLHANIENLLKCARNSNRPWIALLCAIRDIFNYDSQTLSMFLTIFDRTMSPEERTQFYDLIGFGGNLRQSLILNINNIYKSRRSDDIAAHLKSIEPIVNRAIKSGLNTNDPDMLLMATFAQSLSFPMQKSETGNGELITIMASEDKKEYTFIEDFCKKFYGFARNNNVLLLNSFENSVFCVAYINCDKVIYKNICSLSSIDSWVLNNLGNLGFTESRKRNGMIEGFEVFWKEDSEKIQNSLPQFILDKINIQNKCLIFPDIHVLKFPANFIRDSSGYISSKYPVTIILPSLFHRKEYVHSNTPCVNLYYPKDHDLTVIRGIEIIKEEIGSYFNNKLQNKNEVNNPNIAIFIGHGQREGDKFKGVSFGNDGLLLPFEFARVCLSEIVVLFVCHAGFSSNMLFNIDSFSIAKELISRGARHVIAPAWPLNIILIGPWIKTFIHQIEDGKSISESYFLANTKLKELFKIESAWAAMHHYQG